MNVKPLIIKLRKTFKNFNHHTDITCNLKKAKNGSPDWEGIVVSRYIMPIYLPNKRIKTQISIYPLGGNRYCVDNSDIQDYIIKHFKNGDQLQDDVTETLSKANTTTNAKMKKLYGSDESTYQINQNVYQDNSVENYHNLIEQLNAYFQFATQELSTAEILSHNPQYLNSGWQNTALHYGRHLVGSQYDKMADTLKESAEISNSSSQGSYNKYLNSLYSYKSKEFSCINCEKSLSATYNSNFKKSFDSALEAEASYKSSFNSLLSQNPQASSYTSVMDSMSNRTESAEDVFWNSNSSAQISASCLEDRLDNSQVSLEQSMLKSMNDSNSSDNNSHK